MSSSQIESIILVKQNCPQHQDREISWICLEKNCDQRLLCNLCAVKNHNRDHKVEEYDKIKKQGFINVFFGSKDEYTSKYIEDPVITNILEENDKLTEQYSKVNLQNSEEILDNSQEEMQKQLEKNQKKFNSPQKEDDPVQSEIEQNITFMTKLFEHNLRNILKNFENVKDDFRETQIQKIKEAQDLKENAMENLSELEKEMVLIEGTDSLQEKINEALRIVNDEAQSKDEIPALQILNKKTQLVVQLKQHFIQLTKNYLENRFTTDLCSLFEQQLQTIQKEKDSDIQNEEKFLDYLKQKWNKDYSIMENSIQNVISQLNQILRSTLTQKQQQQNTQKLTIQTQKQYYPQQQQVYVQTASGIQVINNQQYQQQQIYQQPLQYQSPPSNSNISKQQLLKSQNIQQDYQNPSNFQGKHSQISTVIQPTQQQYYNQNDQMGANLNDNQEPSSPIHYLNNQNKTQK